MLILHLEKNDKDAELLRRNVADAAVIVKELDLSDEFIKNISIQATLHDVGKLHIHPDILKKPGGLDAGGI